MSILIVLDNFYGGYMNQINAVTGLYDWKSAELNVDNTWKYRLTAQDLHELGIALKHLKSCEVESYLFSKEYFPLPNFSKKLAEISNYLENNRGIFLLRGFPVEQYSQDDIRMMYAGMGAHLGVALRNSIEGELIYNVMDRGKSLTDKGSRGTATKDPLPFHTDRCDVVALLCLKKSKIGGESRVVSAVAIHNEILRTHPDLLAELYHHYYHARTAWETGEENSYYPLPVFSVYQGHFAFRYLRHFINVAQNIPGVPKMTQSQIDALNLLESIANSSEFCADMEFEVGDIQLLNNFVSLHSRSGYEDHDDANLKRLLLRLWLAVPNSRPLSDAFLPLFHNVQAGAVRGGVPEKFNNQVGV